VGGREDEDDDEGSIISSFATFVLESLDRSLEPLRTDATRVASWFVLGLFGAGSIASAPSSSRRLSDKSRNATCPGFRFRRFGPFAGDLTFGGTKIENQCLCSNSSRHAGLWWRLPSMDKYSGVPFHLTED
jgi:hypothetical protein